MEDYHCLVPLSSHPNGEAQGRESEEFASNSHVAETLLVDHDHNLQVPQTMLLMDRVTYKQALQGEVGIVGCEADELVADTRYMQEGNIENINMLERAVALKEQTQIADLALKEQDNIAGLVGDASPQSKE
ncbi:hypothetical protein U1Q18_030713, partial [Sarracenia purpurea var. burkii]